MDTILLEKKFVLEYIKDILNDIKIASGMINNAKYHHNTDYSVAPSILKYGVLSLTDLNKLGIKNYSTEFLKKAYILSLLSPYLRYTSLVLQSILSTNRA